MFPPALAVASLVAATLATAGLVALGRLALDPAAARLAAASLVVSMAVTVTGLMVARARWAQRHGFVLVGTMMILVSLGRPIDAWWIAAAVLLAVAGLASSLRPVRAWVGSVERRVPIPAASVLLMLTLLNAPLAVALTHPDGIGTVSVITAASTWVVLWAYSQAWVPALWLIRFGTPGLAVGWGWGTEWWGWAVVALAAIVILRLAWSEGSLLAVQPLEPRRVDARPILAEMAPEDVRRMAGIDERGRSL